MKLRIQQHNLAWLALLLLWPAAHSQLGAASPALQATVNVLLWFDTEDYLLPADDDACRRLAEMLSQRGIRATFKIVGEKARVLERRGRRDVITALKKHDIAYHTDLHSVHPTPAEYLAPCDLLDGISEFVRREGGGAVDVRRIFGVKTLSCYGQPGSSWAPQAIAALKQIGVAPHGVSCYVDEGDHVGLKGKPFWYADALVIYDMADNWTRMELHDPQAVEPANQKVSAIAERLRTEGGGLISIFYHPCEWVHREFWDGVNFRRGANPPREQWRPPPQRSPEETEAAFQRFGQYMDHIRTIAGVRFVTASDLPGIYPDPVRSGASRRDLQELAKRLLASEQGIDFQVIDHRAYSPADQFELLTLALGQMIDAKTLLWPLPSRGLLGPDLPPPPAGALTEVSWPAFRDATLDVRDFMRVRQRVPARVFVGADAVPPLDFLRALAWAFDYERVHGGLPESETVPLAKVHELLTARHVAADTPGLFGGWVIHKEDFRAPKILEVARLQAWTLKPALRSD